MQAMLGDAMDRAVVTEIDEEIFAEDANPMSCWSPKFRTTVRV